MPKIAVGLHLLVDQRAREEWCLLPYPDHPRGCPNYGKKETCPPKAPWIMDWLRLGHGELWLIYVTFNLEEHVSEMLAKHPTWTYRQARNLLYWQPRVNKKLREEVSALFPSSFAYVVSYCPEAMGVDVIKTAKSVGLPVEVKPQRIVHKIVLVKELVDA